MPPFTGIDREDFRNKIRYPVQAVPGSGIDSRGLLPHACAAIIRALHLPIVRETAEPPTD
ncbi:MAG: hypothetical protein ACO3JG_02650 [Luteolibacter sp.]